jgi:threonine/homoserine efflux transporter RhtA
MIQLNLTLNIHFIIIVLTLILYVVFRYYIYRTKKGKRTRQIYYGIITMIVMYIIYYIKEIIGDERIIVPEIPEISSNF